MGHVCRGLVLELDAQVDHPQAWLHVSRGHISHPSWDSCREEKDLKVLTTLSSALSQDFVHLFFEALLEHLVGLVQDDGL